jgi:hypothetical protein
MDLLIYRPIASYVPVQLKDQMEKNIDYPIETRPMQSGDFRILMVNISLLSFPLIFSALMGRQPKCVQTCVLACASQIDPHMFQTGDVGKP